MLGRRRRGGRRGRAPFRGRAGAGRGTVTPFWSRERHADRQALLGARARILRAVRGWLHHQGFTEAEPAALVAAPGAEVHVGAFAADGRYLHTSPEFAMKKLLAAGEEKIFYLGKCWRRGEIGPLHAEEFTMLEWYRAHESYERVMRDCVELVRLAAREVGAGTALRWRGRTCDPLAEPERLTVRAAFARHRLPPHGSHDEFSRAIVQLEPHLGAPTLTLLSEYPIGEAALARRCAHDPGVSERFELYACGVELANGFGELTDPVEQRARLLEAMDEKERRYGVRWPIDEDFLAALAHMPPASGVALGFDRLVMLATGARHIDDVLWTPP
jgi:lysyl-tRNA synthetase class 2